MKVILVGAATVCGSIVPAGYGSPADRRRLEEARDKTQASIMGANTLRLDNPEMRGLNGSLPPDRIRSIVSLSGAVALNGKKLFRHGPKPVVFTTKNNVHLVLEKLKDAAEVVALPECPHGLSLQAAVDFFRERQVESLLIEGGARLNYSALAQGAVDEILLTILPFVSGNRNWPALVDGPESLGEPFLKFELISCEPVSTGEIFLCYRSQESEVRSKRQMCRPDLGFHFRK